MSNLNDAVESHFRAVRGLTFGPEYLTVMNPDFVVLLVKEYLMYAPSNPATQGQAIADPLKKSLMVLEPVTKACAGLKDALYLLSKAKYLAGDLKSAVSTLQHILDNIDPTDADCHLLMAQIQLHQGNILNAQQSLEVGLSYNFEVRDHPIYHLINAKVMKSHEMVKLILKEKIQQRFTEPYYQNQNKAERMVKVANDCHCNQLSTPFGSWNSEMLAANLTSNVRFPHSRLSRGPCHRVMRCCKGLLCILIRTW